MIEEESFWYRIERLPVRTGVQAFWRKTAGSAFSCLEPYLRATGAQALTLPCDEPGEGCPRKVVVHEPDDMVAICRASPHSRCEDIVVTKKDLAIYQFDLFKLGEHLAAALGLVGPVEPLPGTADTILLGAHVPYAGRSHCVYLTAQSSAEVFTHAVAMLAAINHEPFFLLAPTARLLDQSDRDLIASRGARFVALVDLFDEAPSDQFRLRANSRVIFEGIEGKPVSTANSRPSFRTPALAKWSDLEIVFDNGEVISIRVLGKVGKAGYTEVGMVDRRASRPSKQWHLLERLAEARGVFPSLGQKERKQAQELAARLRDFFGIDGDPFQRDRQGRPERTRFSVRA